MADGPIIIVPAAQTEGNAHQAMAGRLPWPPMILL